MRLLLLLILTATLVPSASGQVRGSPESRRLPRREREGRGKNRRPGRRKREFGTAGSPPPPPPQAGGCEGLTLEELETQYTEGCNPGVGGQGGQEGPLPAGPPPSRPLDVRLPSESPSDVPSDEPSDIPVSPPVPTPQGIPDPICFGATAALYHGIVPANQVCFSNSDCDGYQDYDFGPVCCLAPMCICGNRNQMGNNAYCLE